VDERDQMLELARAMHPTVLTKIPVLLSIPDVSAPMPLVEISLDRGGYGTTLLFAIRSQGDTRVGRVGAGSRRSADLASRLRLGASQLTGRVARVLHAHQRADQQRTYRRDQQRV
jgi:hypothetical protein